MVIQTETWRDYIEMRENQSIFFPSELFPDIDLKPDKICMNCLGKKKIYNI